MYGGDEYEDQLIGDPNQLDDLIQGHDLNPLEDEQPGDENEEDGQDPEKGDDSDKKKVKRKVVLNPQPKLDPIRLTGPRGIATIEGLFRDFKFLGQGYEEQDLKRVMERLELWGNRLFPKYQFDDLLEKVEKLGQKRPVMNFVNKIRMGIVTEDSVADDRGEIIDDDVGMDLDADLAKESTGNGVASDDLFTQLIEEQLTQIDSQKQPKRAPTPIATITEEQRQRMLENRRLAEERRLAKLRAQQEKESALIAACELPQTDAPLEQSDCSKPMEISSVTLQISTNELAKKNSVNGDEDGSINISDVVVSTVEVQNNEGMEMSVIPSEEGE